jgi:hypothetical protein
MRLYLDTEFNGFGGELISLGLAPADRRIPSFYRQVRMTTRVDPWVAKHVIPHMEDGKWVEREVAGALLAAYLRNVDSPVIVADWPTDFEHLLALLISGPGQMHGAPDLTMEYRSLPGFNTASVSRMPHHALADAEALRDHCEALGPT